MINQKIDIEEPFIDQTFEEDQKTKGAFNSIYDLVMNQSDNQDQFSTNEAEEEQELFQEESNLAKESSYMSSNLLFSRNDGDKAKELSRYRQTMDKSREIHRQLLNKKNRWKPSELELAVLKLHFEKNKYPSKEEKELLLKNLEENFNSSIEISQLNRWFQHEREKGIKQGFRNSSKNTYKKFGKEELDYLKEKFSYNTYPKTEEMEEMSRSLGVSLSKIENWYKHNRRSLAKKGVFTLKTKKYFKKDEVGYLLKMFEIFPRPTKEQISEMAEHLKCSELQIKNWYSNKRKKQKLIAKKQSHDTQETFLHQHTLQNFPQITTQNSDFFTSISTSNTPLIAMNNLPQKPETNVLPNIIQSRPLNAFQIPQASAPQVFTGAPLVSGMNGIYGGNEIQQIQLPGGFPNGTVPIILVPATSLNSGGQLQLDQSSFNPMILQKQDSETKIQQQQPFLLKNNNQMLPIQQSPSNPMISFNNMVPQHMLSSIPNVLPTFNSLKQNDQNMGNLGNIGNGDMNGNSWMNNVQHLQNSNPIIIFSSNKPPMIQGQQLPFNFQNQQGNFTSANINNGTINAGTFMNNNFSQNGNQMQGMVPYEQPMQIQYLTSLYCPYSNNNIFSSYHPVVYQNNPSVNNPNSGKQGMGVESMGTNQMINPMQLPHNGSINIGALRTPDNTREHNNFV